MCLCRETLFLGLLDEKIAELRRTRELVGNGNRHPRQPLPTLQLMDTERGRGAEVAALASPMASRGSPEAAASEVSRRILELGECSETPRLGGLGNVQMCFDFELSRCSEMPRPGSGSFTHPPEKRLSTPEDFSTRDISNAWYMI